jgi:hypothetical protein
MFIRWKELIQQQHCFNALKGDTGRPTEAVSVPGLTNGREDTDLIP